MVKEILKVHNFGPVKALDIEFKPITLFIGTQGSGKSTVSKLLTICRDNDWYIRLLDRQDVMKPFADFNIEEYFKPDTYIYYSMDDEIEVVYESGEFKLNISGLSPDVSRVRLREKVQQANEDLIKQYMSEPSEIGLIDNNVLNANSRTMLYIPAERNLVGNLSSALASIMLAKIPLSNTIIEYMSLFEKAKKEYPRYNIPFLGVRYEKKEGNERIVVSEDGKDLPLNACSSGLQSVLPMIMVIDYALKVSCFDSFVIEEPEQNLFPKNQRELLSFITSRLKSAHQFVITSHSPYLLSSLNVLMLAHTLYENASVQNEVAAIVPADAMVNPEDVAVYGLTPENEEYCTSLIQKRTGLISVNALDSVSENIGDDYDRLYRIYLKTRRKS